MFISSIPIPIPIPIVTVITFITMKIMMRGGYDMPGDRIRLFVEIAEDKIKKAKMVAAKRDGKSGEELSSILNDDVPIDVLVSEKVLKGFTKEVIQKVMNLMKSGDIATSGDFHCCSAISFATTKHFTKVIAVAVVVDGLNVAYSYAPAVKEYFFPENVDAENTNPLAASENTDDVSVEIKGGAQVDEFLEF